MTKPDAHEILSLKTRERSQFIDVTHEIKRLIEKSKVTNGICYLFVPHTTTGLIVNENADPDVVREMFVLIGKGNLLLGRWQGIFFFEFNGPRNRELLAKIIPDPKT